MGLIETYAEIVGLITCKVNYALQAKIMSSNMGLELPLGLNQSVVPAFQVSRAHINLTPSQSVWHEDFLS